MNNPFSNFDLELFLENFPDVVRQPMPLAIGASVLAHGLFFLGLPVVTGASDKTEKPERIVNVIELSPAEQAKLPQSAIATSQIPLPLGTSGNFPPLAGLSPSATPSLPPVNPVNPFSGIDTTPNPIFSSSSSPIFNEPIFTPRRITIPAPTEPTPSPTPTPSPSASPSPTPSPTPTASPSPNPSPTTLPSVEPNVQPTIAAGQTPLPPATPSPTPTGAAADLKTQPAGNQPLTEQQLKQLEEQRKVAEERQKLVVATTYNVAGTTETEQNSEVQKQFFSVYNTLKTAGGDELVAKVIANYREPSKEMLANQTIPNGWNLNFNGQPAKPIVQTIVQVYLNDGGQAIAPPAVIRSSGFKGLDQQALNVVIEELKKKPRAGKYQAIEFTIPFDLQLQPVS